MVNISTTQRRSVPAERPRMPRGFEIPDLPEDSPFREFFRRFFGEGEIEEFDTQSLGSGFIISQDGFIISNNHVVRNADEVVVRLSDRREFTATVVGTDEPSDVALLKIDAEGLPAVRIGIGYELKVGEWGPGNRLSVRGSTIPSPRASFPPRAAACLARTTFRSSRPTSPSILETPVVPCSTSTARSWG